MKSFVELPHSFLQKVERFGSGLAYYSITTATMSCRQQRLWMGGFIMTVLLRNKLENQYYSGPGQWTGDRRQAREFNGGGEAVREAMRERLLEAEVVYHFEDTQDEIAVPVYIPEPVNPWGSTSGRRSPEAVSG